MKSKSNFVKNSFKIAFENYWKKKANLIYWHKRPKYIVRNRLFYEDGRVNIAYNCIQTNIDRGLKNKIAVHLIDKNEKQTQLSYQELENP